MDFTLTLASSALVAAVVGGFISVVTQRWLLERKAQVDYDRICVPRLSTRVVVLLALNTHGPSP